MKWVRYGILALLLALPAARGEDTPKDEKKPPSADEQYKALLKDFTAQQRDVLAEVRKAKGPEQEKLVEKYYALGKEFAGKFYQLAEDNPKGPVAMDALLWILQHGNGSPVYQKATDQVTTLIGEMPLADLSRRLTATRQSNPALLDAVLRRAEKDEKEALSADLLAWAAEYGYYMPAGQKALARLAEKFPDHAGLERACLMLGRAGEPEAADALKVVLEKTTNPKVKAAAALGIGRALAAKTDTLGNKPDQAEKVAAEAEKFLTQAIALYGKDSAAQTKEAEQELQALRTLRVGKEVPEIRGPDLDGKDFKLSDYRGKVVLLDFWGNW